MSLQEAVVSQDSGHLETLVLIVINGDRGQTESEYESDFDSKVFDKINTKIMNLIFYFIYKSLVYFFLFGHFIK